MLMVDRRNFADCVAGKLFVYLADFEMLFGVSKKLGFCIVNMYWKDFLTGFNVAVVLSTKDK